MSVWWLTHRYYDAHSDSGPSLEVSYAVLVPFDHALPIRSADRSLALDEDALPEADDHPAYDHTSSDHPPHPSDPTSRSQPADTKLDDPADSVHDTDQKVRPTFAERVPLLEKTGQKGRWSCG